VLSIAGVVLLFWLTGLRGWLLVGLVFVVAVVWTLVEVNTRLAAKVMELEAKLEGRDIVTPVAKAMSTSAEEAAIPAENDRIITIPESYRQGRVDPAEKVLIDDWLVAKEMLKSRAEERGQRQLAAIKAALRDARIASRVREIEREAWSWPQNDPYRCHRATDKYLLVAKMYRLLIDRGLIAEADERCIEQQRRTNPELRKPGSPNGVDGEAPRSADRV
jgi:hypothetical protein